MTVGLEPEGPAKLSRAQISTFATSPAAVANYEAIQNAAFVTNPQLAAAASAAAADASADAAAANANAASRQPSSANLTAITALDATPGLVEQVSAGSFTKRTMGVGASTSVPTRADGDTRWVIKGTGAGWLAVSGTGQTGGFTTYGPNTASATYSQTQIQTLMDSLQAVSQNLKGLIDDLKARGGLS